MADSNPADEKGMPDPLSVNAEAEELDPQADALDPADKEEASQPADQEPAFTGAEEGEGVTAPDAPNVPNVADPSLQAEAEAMQEAADLAAGEGQVMAEDANLAAGETVPEQPKAEGEGFIVMGEGTDSSANELRDVGGNLQDQEREGAELVPPEAVADMEGLLQEGGDEALASAVEGEAGEETGEGLLPEDVAVGKMQDEVPRGGDVLLPEGGNMGDVYPLEGEQAGDENGNPGMHVDLDEGRIMDGEQPRGEDDGAGILADMDGDNVAEPGLQGGEGEILVAAGVEAEAPPENYDLDGGNVLEGLGPVDNASYGQNLPHPYYPVLLEGDAGQALLEQQEYQGNGMLAAEEQQQLAVSADGEVEEEVLLDEQRRALEEEHGALLAEQQALSEAEHQQQQQQQQENYNALEEHYNAPEEQHNAHDEQYNVPEQHYVTPPYNGPEQQYTAPEEQCNAPEEQYAAPEEQYAAPEEQYVVTEQYNAPEKYNMPGSYEHQPDVYGSAYGITSSGNENQAIQAAPSVDVDALLAAEREKHNQELRLETRAREELEDMILRIEKHFKAEKAARQKAEELLQQAIAAEMDAKNKLEDVMQKRGQEQKILEEERMAINRERQALESMRQEFDHELQAARSEVGKAQEALAGSEERIRAAEQVERARLEAEYQTKLAAMQMEMDRMREEMTYRTMVMQDEMENWRQQAQITANAVLEAKGEVMERKRELDSTKEKMDRLLDKLLVGRERGIELSGAIASNQRMMNFLPGMGFMPGLNPMGGPGQPGLLPAIHSMPSLPTMGMAPMGKMPAGQGAPQGPWVNNYMGMGMGPAGSHLQAMPPAESRAPKLPPLNGYSSPWSPGDNGGQSRRSASADNAPDYAMDDQQYAHVQSRFAQGAAEVGMAGKSRQRMANKQGNSRNKKADRFEEAEKEAKRNAAMSKWN